MEAMSADLHFQIYYMYCTMLVNSILMRHFFIACVCYKDKKKKHIGWQC